MSLYSNDSAIIGVGVPVRYVDLVIASARWGERSVHAATFITECHECGSKMSRARVLSLVRVHTNYKRYPGRVMYCAHVHDIASTCLRNVRGWATYLL